MQGFKRCFVTPSCDKADKAKIMSSSSTSDEDSFCGDEVLSAIFEQGNKSLHPLKNVTSLMKRKDSQNMCGLEELSNLPKRLWSLIKMLKKVFQVSE